jgi:hypothetical protein
MIPRQYSIPNGLPDPSTARARFGPALCGPTLCGPIDVSCRAVSGVVPGWQPRHGPIADFSGRAGTASKTAHRAVTRPGTIRGDPLPQRRSWRPAPRGSSWIFVIPGRGRAAEAGGPRRGRRRRRPAPLDAVVAPASPGRGGRCSSVPPQRDAGWCGRSA